MLQVLDVHHINPKHGQTGLSDLTAYELGHKEHEGQIHTSKFSSFMDYTPINLGSRISPSSGLVICIAVTVPCYQG